MTIFTHIDANEMFFRYLFYYIVLAVISKSGLQLNFIASLGIGRIFFSLPFYSNSSFYLITIYNLFKYIYCLYIYLPAHFHDINNVYH